jgi:hypothetical protein
MYPKPVQSFVMHQQNKNWNPYIPFAMAQEWRIVALAPQHKVDKRIVDYLNKGFLWKVGSLLSAEYMLRPINFLLDALGHW